MSDIFNVNAKEFGRGAVNAVFIAVLAAFTTIAGDGFNLFEANWQQVGQTMANVGFIAFVSYVSSVFISDKEGKILGKM